MFSSFSLPFSIPTFGWGRRRDETDLSPVRVHETETASDKTSKRLQSLIKLNHANHSIIYNNLRFHNHTPHILGSAYILGATPDQLTKIYEAESANLEPWHDSPGEISEDDWRDYLGKREYQRAYVDFFEDQLVKFGYDWKKLLDHYLYSGKEPLINSLVSGLGHPLIHLGYGHEIASRHVAIEALALGTCFYSSLHKYIDDPSYTRPSPYKTTSVLTILERVRKDTRLDGLLDHMGADNIETLLAEREDVVLEHWNAWDISASNMKTCFREAQKAAVALVVGTPDHPPTPPGRHATKASSKHRKRQKYYDFFLLHSFTTSHALRILLHPMRPESRVPVVRSWLLFALLAYMGQLRPRVDVSHITEYPLEREEAAEAGAAKGKGGADASWEYVRDVALNGPHATDPHFVKGLRGCWVAEETWGADVPHSEEDSDSASDESKDGGKEVLLKDYWRKAAVRMADEFLGWGGFDAKTEGYHPEH